MRAAAAKKPSADLIAIRHRVRYRSSDLLLSPDEAVASERKRSREMQQCPPALKHIPTRTYKRWCVQQDNPPPPRCRAFRLRRRARSEEEKNNATFSLLGGWRPLLAMRWNGVEVLVPTPAHPGALAAVAASCIYQFNIYQLYAFTNYLLSSYQLLAPALSPRCTRPAARLARNDSLWVAASAPTCFILRRGVGTEHC